MTKEEKYYNSIPLSVANSSLTRKGKLKWCNYHNTLFNIKYYVDLNNLIDVYK